MGVRVREMIEVKRKRLAQGEGGRGAPLVKKTKQRGKIK